MDLSRPFEALLPTVDSAVLVVLAGSTKSRTGREVARLAGRSQPATQAVLDRFVEHGLVLKEEAGRSRLYRLNSEHLAAGEIAALAHMREGLLHRLGEAVEGWDPAPVTAAVFGSAARGDGDTRSDIDILLVRPAAIESDDEAWRRQVNDLAESVLRWTGNYAGVAEVDEGELEQLRADRPPIVAELEADAVRIAGKPLGQLLKGT